MYPSIFNHFYVIGRKSYKVRRNNAWPLRHWRSFKLTDFGTNRKPMCEFPLVINSNYLLPILHRFQIMADYWSTFAIAIGGFTLTPSLWVIPGWFPANIRIRFTCPETKMILYLTLRMIVSSFVRTKHQNVTDGQTDGQNSSGYYSGRHCEQCGRAVKTSKSILFRICRRASTYAIILTWQHPLRSNKQQRVFL